MKKKPNLEIGHFQFENLIRNRIPFHLVSLATDTQSKLSHFDVIEKKHLEGCLVTSEVKKSILDFSNTKYIKEVDRIVAQRKIQTHDPIVVTCEKGKTSLKLAEAFFQKGFHNTYFLKEGLQNFKI